MAAKASDSSRLYIAAAVFAAVLGTFAAGVIDLSAAQPEKAPAAVMERPPPVERATAAKSKAASSDPADVRAQPEAAADGKRDKNPSCATWAAGGECANNPAFMATDCAASCRGMLPEQSEPVAVAGGQTEPEASLEPEAEGLTNLWPAPQLPPELERAQAESDALGPRPESLLLHGPKACVDLRDDCGSLARHNLSGCGEARAMYRLHVHCMCAACALLHGVCTACALHVRCVCTACALHVHCMCTACALHVHCVCTACALHVRCVCAACALRLHCVCTACVPHVHCVCAARALRVCRTCTAHVHCARAPHRRL